VKQPAIDAVVVVADVVKDAGIFGAADVANTYYAPVEEVGILQVGPETYLLEVGFVVVVVVANQVIFIPFEFLEQEETPPEIQVDNALYFSEDVFQFVVEAGERDDLIGLFFNGLFLAVASLVGAGNLLVLIRALILLIVVLLVIIVVVKLIVHVYDMI
jgi:hypothetical protein